MWFLQLKHPDHFHPMASLSLSLGVPFMHLLHGSHQGHQGHQGDRPVSREGRGQKGGTSFSFSFSGTILELHTSLCSHPISQNLVSWPHLRYRQGGEMHAHGNLYPAKIQSLAEKEG